MSLPRNLGLWRQLFPLTKPRVILCKAAKVTDTTDLQLLLYLENTSSV